MSMDKSGLNLRWFNERSAQYPYQVITKLSLKPDEVHKAIPPAHNFIRVPISGQAFWGFETEVGMGWFKKNYADQLLTPQED